ncbi:MAG: hypothetical protein ABSA57_01800 [Candidatus Acidiferrales bacterium]
MDRPSLRSCLVALVAIWLILCGAACSVPLAPGYRILKQSREVRFVPDDRGELRVDSHDRFENSGTADLSFIDVNLPDETSYGRKDLHAGLDSRVVPLESLPGEHQRWSPNARRIEFDPVWKRRESRDLAIEYAFSSPEDSGSQITLGKDDFHLGSRGWSPLPQPPHHFLSPYPGRPARVIFTVRVPSSFMVLARGAPAGRKQQGEETVYRFELRKGDLTPFVVAGKYVASAPERKSQTAIFWTFRPLKDTPEPALKSIDAAWGDLEKDFGRLDRNIHVPHIVESTGLRNHLTGESGAAAVAFPGGVLVNSEALSLGIASEAFLGPVTHALAHNWFGDEVFFAPDAALGMGEGLPEYATIVVAESEKGEPGRRQRIVEYFNDYDKARRQADETPLGLTMLSDPIGQRRIALAKAPLFFIALEDACGEEPVRSGLRQMVTLLRGQETSYDVLRAALEQSSGKNLAAQFRVWLNDTGIPADFRARYEGPAANAQQ